MTMTERFLLRLEDMLPNLIAAVIILVAGFLITRVTLRIMGKGLNLKHVDPTIHKFLMSMVKVVMTVIIVVSALSAVKVPMSSIIAAIGTAGIAIGLALQDSLSNVAGGFVILFAKPFKCGDYVKIGTDEGTVDAISMLYTRLLTIDNKAVFIPNSNVAKSSVTNFTDEDRRRLEIRFAVSYRDDFRKAEKLIREVIEGHQKILTSSPSAFIATVAAVFTFWQTQDLSAQHRYIFTPFLIIAMAAPIVAALEHRSDTARKACAFLLPAFGVTGFLFSFSVLPAPATAIPLFTGSTLMSPLQQGDVEEKEQLVNYLNDVVTTNDSVYFASASINVNSTLVESVNLSMGNVDDSMNVCSADVDSRDGFNTGFFDCDYVVAAVPTQYHMRPENERVVGALSEGVSDSLSVVGSHYEAMRSFNMDGDAKVTVYRKIRDYTDDEVRQLQKQFDGFYPDLPELFHDRFDTYLANR